MCGEKCDFCGASVGEYGDFTQQIDGTIVCDDCMPDDSPGDQGIHCEICGEDKWPDQFVDESVPVCSDCLHAGAG
ncbi:hypothetical protein D3C72_66590 [compost metagenome]